MFSSLDEVIFHQVYVHQTMVLQNSSNWGLIKDGTDTDLTRKKGCWHVEGTGPDQFRPADRSLGGYFGATSLEDEKMKTKVGRDETCPICGRSPDVG